MPALLRAPNPCRGLAASSLIRRTGGDVRVWSLTGGCGLKSVLGGGVCSAEAAQCCCCCCWSCCWRTAAVLSGACVVAAMGVNLMACLVEAMEEGGRRVLRLFSGLRPPTLGVGPPATTGFGADSSVVAPPAGARCAPAASSQFMCMSTVSGELVA